MIKSIDKQYRRAVGNAIREKIFEKGLSVREVAEKVGISRQRLYDFQDGTAVPNDNIFNDICKQLEISNKIEITVKIG